MRCSSANFYTAELRGPGFRDPFEEGANECDLEVDRTRGFSIRSGRIILLGDGTEVMTEQNEDEMFDHADEGNEYDNHEEQESEHEQEHPGSTRNEREDTPAPQLTNDAPIQSSETSPVTKPEELTSRRYGENENESSDSEKANTTSSS